MTRRSTTAYRPHKPDVPTVLGLILLAFLQLVSAAWAQAPAPTPFALPDLDIRTGGSVSAIALQSDGRWVIAGAFFHVQGKARRTLARLDAQGLLDPGFNPGIEGGSVQSLAATADAIFIAGSFSSVNGVARPGLAKLHLDGGLDEGWQVSVSRGSVSTIAASPNGWIWIGGIFTTVNGEARRFLARVNAESGALGPTLHPDWSNIAQIDAHASGIYVRSTGTSGIRRLDPESGEHDASWNPNTSFRNAFVIAGSYMYALGGSMVRRINLGSGVLDPTGTWSATLEFEETPAGADGSYLYTNRARRFDLASALLVPDAKLSSLGGGTSMTVLASAGRLIWAGSFSAFDQSPALGVMALDESDYALQWEGGVEGLVSASVKAIAHLDDGSHLIGGDFVAVEGHIRRGLARLHADGSLDTSWSAELDQVGLSSNADRPSVSHIAVAEDGVYVAGAFNRVDGATRPGLARLGMDGRLDTAFNPLLGSSLKAMLLHESGLFIGQNSGHLLPGGGGQRTNPVKLDRATGAVVTDWVSEYQPGSLGVNAMVDAGDALLVAGASEGLGSELRHGLAKLDYASGTRDPDFVPILQGRTSGTTLQRVLLAGDALYADGFKLDAATGQPYPGWTVLLVPSQSGNVASGSISPNALGLRDGLLFVGGNGSLEINRSQRRGIYARDSASGRLDYRWSPNPDGHVDAISVDSTGRVWVGGPFRAIGGQPRRALAVLPPLAPPTRDTRLHSLSSNQGTPAYSDDVDEFTINSNPAGTVFAVTAIPVDRGALLQLEGRSFPSHQRSHELPLAWGRNEFALTVIADDRTTRRDIRLVVQRNAQVSCDAARLADLRLLDASVERINGAWRVSATLQNAGPRTTVASYTTPISPTGVHYSLNFHAVSPDGRRGDLRDDREYQVALNINETRSRIANMGGPLFSPGAEMDVVLDYFCDPEPSNNSIRIRLPADEDAPPSDDARLFALAPGSGLLSPAFSPGVFDYRLALGFGVDQISVVPTAMQPASQIRVNGSPVPSNAASAAIPLAVGETVIAVEVTAADGTSRLTYTVTAERAPEPSLTVECLGGAAMPAGDGAERHDYALSISNTGDAAIAGLRLRAPPPTQLIDTIWTCSSPLGCAPPFGSGALDAQLSTLGPGETALAEISGFADPDANFVELRAEVTDADGFRIAACRIDAPANGRGLYRDGFEG